MEIRAIRAASVSLVPTTTANHCAVRPKHGSELDGLVMRDAGTTFTGID